ncbi:MAG: rod shape-determining protein RodA [Mariniphaga sp.]
MARNKLWTNIDWITVILFILLVFAGWLNIYSAVYNDTEQHSIFDFSQRYGKQLIWILAAFLIAFTILLIETNFYLFFSYIIYGLVIFTLVLVLLFGTEINYSKSWLTFGWFSFQPAEFGKFAAALALAKFMSSFGFKLSRPKSIAIISLIVLLPAFLIFLQNDTGSALVYSAFILVLYREGLSGVVLFFGTLIALLFIFSLVLPEVLLFGILTSLTLLVYMIANPGLKYFFRVIFIWVSVVILFAGLNFLLKTGMEPGIILAGTLLLGGVVVWIYSARNKLKNYVTITIIFIGAILFSLSVDFTFSQVLNSYQQARIHELLGIESDPLGVGYNVNQSKIAIGSGGFWGKGFLNGTQTKYKFVPEQSTDFIFCTVGEEWGFAGTFVVVSLFVALFIRLIFLAERQRSGFSRIYGYAAAVIFFFHFAVNIGMTIGMMPVIGIPLPFFSYGGSSLWGFTILLFIFIRLDASRLDYLSY